jgi:hypothetical protein
MTVSTLAPRARRRMEPPKAADRVTQYALDVLAGRVVVGRARPEGRRAPRLRSRDRRRARLSFDVAAAEKAIDFFPLLRHYKGEWGPGPGKPKGDPIVLEDWQAFAVGARSAGSGDGTRRFRSVYLEVAKKNGKTLLAGGVGLLLAFFDGEPGAEVYRSRRSATRRSSSWNDADSSSARTPCSPRGSGQVGCARPGGHRLVLPPLGRDSGEASRASTPTARSSTSSTSSTTATRSTTSRPRPPRRSR